MYRHDLKKLSRVLLLLILATFVLAVFLGPTNSIGMQMNANGQMSGCMFTGTGICSMTPLEHAATWEAMFTAVPAQTASVLLLLLLILAVVSVLTRTLRPVFDFSLDRISVRQRLYAKQSRARAYINPIQEALSQGILNPKTY